MKTFEKPMKNNEKPMKNFEQQWKPMKNNVKPMKNNEKQWKTNKSLRKCTFLLQKQWESSGETLPEEEVPLPIPFGSVAASGAIMAPINTNALTYSFVRPADRLSDWPIDEVLIRPPNNPKITPKQPQNNAKTTPKQPQNNPKTIPKQPQNNPKTIPKQFQNNPKTIPKQPQNNPLIRCLEGPYKGSATYKTAAYSRYLRIHNLQNSSLLDLETSSSHGPRSGPRKCGQSKNEIFGLGFSCFVFFLSFWSL